jgi:hypothetical protein
MCNQRREKKSRLPLLHIQRRIQHSPSVHQKRKELIPAMKAARACGEIAYIRYDRFIVHPPFQNPGRDERDKPIGS